MSLDEDQEPEDFYYGEPLPDGNGTAHVIRLMGHEVLFIHRRRKYRGFNEIPMEGHLDMNTRTKKFLAKRALEFAAAAVIGYIIKAEKKYESKIDEHFAPPRVDETEED